MRRQFARLATRSVRYLEAGEGRPLVLLHAFPLSAEQWLPQLARVPPGWRFVAPDLRGFGGPPPEPVMDGEITMDTHASDVFELMAHLDMPSAVVCGLSMGGYVAMAMVRKASERLRGLLLADTRAAADSEEGRVNRDRMLVRLSEGGPRAIADDMLPKLLGATSAREQPDLGEALRRTIEETHPEGIAAGLRALKRRPDSTESLRQLRCPVLVVVGDEDVITPPAEAQELHALVDGAQLARIHGAGHLSNLESPAEFNHILADWVASLPRG